MTQVSRRKALSLAAGGCISAAFWSLGASPASALIVQPIRIDMRCNGPRASAQLRATNDHPYPLPIEVSYERLSLGERGPPVLTPTSGEEFLIFPPQVTVPQGATQNFRIQWVGDPALAESQLFMFTVRQLPIPRADQAPGIELLYSIQAVVCVAPPRGGPNLQVEAVGRATTADGAPGVELAVRNAAPVHGYLSMQRVSIRQANAGGDIVWSGAIEAAVVNSAVGMGLVPPNALRRFVIPFDLPSGGSFSAVLTEVQR